MIRLLHVGLDIGLEDPIYLGDVLLQEPEMHPEDAQRLIQEEFDKTPNATIDDFFEALLKSYPQFFLRIESKHPVVLKKTP